MASTGIATPSNAPKVIVVFGATGAQGGSVVQAMKDDKRFVLKAATRNPDSDKAKALVAQGVEVVKVDMDDVESTKKALQGAYGVFLVTNYWEIFDVDRETKQGKNVVDAVKACGVQHLVFSGLQGTKEAIGKTAAHMEGKVQIQHYIAEQGVPFTTVRMPCYYENFLAGFKPTKNEKDEYVLALPMGDEPFYMICISEVGECIHQIFVRPDEFKGQNIGLCSDKQTISGCAAIMSKVLAPKKFVAGNVTTEQYAKFGFPGAEDLAIMFEFNRSGKIEADIDLTRRLNPKISTFEQWVENNRASFD
jgi:uncharacterized protein YbjT (DUF2867 family)